MSIGYPISIGVIGFFILIALWPPTRPRLLARAAYAPGLTVNEVPHLTAGVPLGLATVETAAKGDFGRKVASVIAVAGAAGTGLVAIARRGIRSWIVVTEAMDRAGMDAPECPRGWVWRTLGTPIPFRPRGVARVANLRYGDHRRQRLDVYHRPDLPLGGPVLVYLHGGGYSGGTHHEGRALLHHLADARAALRWARDHAQEYGGAADRVVMASSSAGAHLSSLLVLDPSTRLAGAIFLYGYYGRHPSEPVPSTPFASSAENAPSFFIAHGDRDTWTSAAGGQHDFDLWRSWRNTAVIAGIEEFGARATSTDPTRSRETQTPTARYQR